MPFEKEQVSDGFGVPGVEIKQTLLDSIDPFGGIEITSSFQNTQRDFTNKNSDGRIALGMFYFEDDNVLSNNFPDRISNPLFRQMNASNMIINGDCKYKSLVLHTNTEYGQSVGLPKSEIIIPGGGWGCLALDGVFRQKSVNTPVDSEYQRVFVQDVNHESYLGEGGPNPGGIDLDNHESGYGGYLPYVAMPESIQHRLILGNKELLLGTPEGNTEVLNDNPYHHRTFASIPGSNLGGYESIPPIAAWVTTPKALSNNKCLVFDSVSDWNLETCNIWSGLGGTNEEGGHFNFRYADPTPYTSANINVFDVFRLVEGNNIGNNHYRTLNQYQTIHSLQDSADKQINPYTSFKVKFSMLTHESSADSYFPSVEAGIISFNPSENIQGVSVGGYYDSSEVEILLNSSNYLQYNNPPKDNIILFKSEREYVGGSTGYVPSGVNTVFDFYHPNGNVFNVDMRVDGTQDPDGDGVVSGEFGKEGGMVRTNLGDTGDIKIWSDAKYIALEGIELGDSDDVDPQDILRKRQQRGAFLMYVGSDKTRFPNMNEQVDDEGNLYAGHQKEFVVAYYDPFTNEGDYPYWVYDDGRTYVAGTDYTANTEIGAFEVMKDNNQFTPNANDCIIMKLHCNGPADEPNISENLSGGLSIDLTSLGDPGNNTSLQPSTYQPYDLLLATLGVDDYGLINEDHIEDFFRQENYDPTIDSDIPYPEDHVNNLNEIALNVMNFLFPTTAEQEPEENQQDAEFFVATLLSTSLIPGPLFQYPTDFLLLLVADYLGLVNGNYGQFQEGNLQYQYRTLNRPGFLKSKGNFNSSRYGNYDTFPEQNINNQPSPLGSMTRFRNTELNVWEQKEFNFNLDGVNVQDLHFFIQAGDNWSVGNGKNRVYLDNFEVIESYEFIPDCDVRKKKGGNEFGIGDLTEYYDKKIQTQAYNDTSAPLEVQFYFYPTYKSEKVFDVERTPIYQEFKKGLFYMYDIDWGDGSPKEFTTEPKMIDEETSLYHTYEKSGVFEVTGYMIRMKPDKDDNPIGVIYNKKFRLRINVNEALDEDFTYFGSDGFSFIPYKNTLPIVGGVSQESAYYKSIKRQLGFINDDIKTFVEFEKSTDKLKTELAMLKMDSSLENSFEILPSYIKERGREDSFLVDPVYLSSLPFPLTEAEFNWDHPNNFTAPMIVHWHGDYGRPDISILMYNLMLGHSLSFIYPAFRPFLPDESVTENPFFYPQEVLDAYEQALMPNQVSIYNFYDVLNNTDLPLRPPEDFYNFETTATFIYTGISTNKEELGKSIGDVDITSIKFFNTTKQMWEILGFENQDTAIPNNPRYWKNIIPKDNYSIFNREGVNPPIEAPFDSITLNYTLSVNGHETLMGMNAEDARPLITNFFEAGNSYVSGDIILGHTDTSLNPTLLPSVMGDNTIYWDYQDTPVNEITSLLGLNDGNIHRIMGYNLTSYGGYSELAEYRSDINIFVGSLATLKKGQLYIIILSEDFQNDMLENGNSSFVIQGELFEPIIFLPTPSQKPIINQTITNSQQEWIGENEHGNTYYYPVLPRYGSDGRFIENDYPNDNIPFAQNGSITNDSEQLTDLLINISTETSGFETNVLNDNSGNGNLGFTISDYKVNFDNKTSEPKKIKNTERIRTTKNNGAF